MVNISGYDDLKEFLRNEETEIDESDIKNLNELKELILSKIPSDKEKLLFANQNKIQLIGRSMTQYTLCNNHEKLVNLMFIKEELISLLLSHPDSKYKTFGDIIDEYYGKSKRKNVMKILSVYNRCMAEIMAYAKVTYEREIDNIDINNPSFKAFREAISTAVFGNGKSEISPVYYVISLITKMINETYIKNMQFKDAWIQQEVRGMHGINRSETIDYGGVRKDV